MRNLALQGEIRHVLPAPSSLTDGVGGIDESRIVSVIQNTSADLHIGGGNFGGHCADGDSTQPPASFVVTSAGYLLALDANDGMVWKVDLEKVVDESNDEEEDEEGEEGVASHDGTRIRSRWFYAASFLQENSPDALDDVDDDVMGMNLNSEGGLHITCLSRAGHVVSVSAEGTDSIASKGGHLEEGSECIGSFENGLECGGWSPDGEVLALVTFASDDDDGDDGTGAVINAAVQSKVPILMTMNTQYEILAEVRLEPSLLPGNCNDADGSIDPNAISLCWRPDSSSLAVSTMDADVNGKPLRRIRTYHRTTLQILSLSKEEDGSGRDVPNLLPVAPTWAPAGCSHYVGAIQSSRPLAAKSARARQVSMQVAFMEPNGLRHRECKIHNTADAKTDKEDIMFVAFNLEGDLLAVISQVTAADCQYGKVQLYHRSNYHWYLKYELRYEPGVTVSNAKFSDEDPYRIMVALAREEDSSLEWREYIFRWESSTVHYRNIPSSASSSVLVVVVDGKTLNFTPLDKAIIPPPMYASSMDLPAPIVGITSRPCFHNEVVDSGRVEFVVALSTGKYALLHYGGGANGVSLTPGFQPPSLLGIVDPYNIGSSDELNESGFSLKGISLRDAVVIDADDDSLTLAAVACSSGISGKRQFKDNVVEMKVSCGQQADSANTEANVVVSSILELEGRALRIANWSDTAQSAGARGSALLQLSDGSLLEYSQGGVVEPCEAGALLEACPWVAGIYDSSTVTASTSSSPDGNSSRLVIGLSSRYRLYCGERLLSSASSSFAVSLQHRFVTHVTIGSQPQLRFLPLASLTEFDPFMGHDDQNAALDGYEPRSVERGARLVAVFPTKPFLILQMPRGNLESIGPRALVLPYVMLKIQNGDYLTALDIMRRQRVDMNLIVDLDPSAFLNDGGAEKFIGQIEKIDNINLFLSSLIDVDTTLWKYPVPSWIRAEPVQHPIEKVNQVCQKVRQVMLDAEKDGMTSSGKLIKEGHFLLPVLSTFAKETPPKLEDALLLIKSTAKELKKKSRFLSEHVQSSIQYLAFLADYEMIFNTAIGMYDFELAKAVARHSQMDPKVYLPMLKRWRELPESTARYEVDVKLRRYESALRHLVVSDQGEGDASADDHFAKCLAFVEEHSLHKLGLELFRGDASKHRSIMVSLGERLMTDRKPKDALTVFLACNLRYLDGGKRAARACSDWRAYFACCAEDNKVIGSDQATAVAETISAQVGSSMREQREHYVSAATILLDYAEDVSYAVDMLVSARLWSEGRRIAHLHKRSDLVKKVVNDAVSYARTCVEDLAERAETFQKTNKRYAEVVVIRRDAIREAEEAGVTDLHHDDSASMFSMQSTASNTSLRSSASGTSVGSVGTVGSVASVSTVISVGATSTFSFTGDVDAMKHKSKFNKLGRDKKKKKPKKKGPNARRMKPGSEEELKELTATLGHACPDDYYVEVITDTVNFLLQSDKLSMAKLLFDAYEELSSLVLQSQTARLEQDAKERAEREKKDRMEGNIHEPVEHPCEKEIDAIRCKPLQDIGVLSYLF